MAHQLLYTQTAFSDIKKLDVVAKKRIKKKLEEYAKNPHSFAKRLVNHVIGSYRFRIGNYRVVFDMDKNKIVILRIGHRREIYR